VWSQILDGVSDFKSRKERMKITIIFILDNWHNCMCVGGGGGGGKKKKKNPFFF
jgi:hypothetical protein